MSEEKTNAKTALSYRDAGVDIDAGNALVDRIKPLAKRTLRPEVMGNLGGFGALCKLPTGYKNPVLVSGTDGVGTKLKLAIDSNTHDGVGIDLVAMCVNDLLVTGAEPLFFLDYYASASLDVDIASSVISGIAKGCELAGAALIGGETAEMPGMYQAGDYDLAGFCVGVAEEEAIITGENIEPGMKVIALGSSGAHSNGYSLIRKVLEHSGSTLEDMLDGEPLKDYLLEPTRIYVKSVLEAQKQITIHGLAHITGGGLTENIPRVLPNGCSVKLSLDSWSMPTLFGWLQEKGNIETQEMLRTFNCGVGMIAVVDADNAEHCLETLLQQGENAWIIGDVIAEEDEPKVVYVGELS